jgi:hypothetical protein
LFGRPDQHLVDRNTPPAYHHERDRPSDVVGLQALHQGEQGVIRSWTSGRLWLTSGDGGSTGQGRPGGPAAGDELAVPAQDCRRRDEQTEAAARRE